MRDRNPERSRAPRLHKRALLVARILLDAFALIGRRASPRPFTSGGAVTRPSVTGALA
jgi:hypothetical protein